MCGINEQSLDQSCVSHGPVRSNVNNRLFHAYGACFLGSDGGEQINEWGQRWKRVVSIRGQQYVLPGGSVGREFVNLLTNEVSMLSRGEAISERLIVFCGVVLQRDSMVNKGMDIRRLLKRRMDAWKQNRFDELVYELERCARIKSKVRSSNSEDHIIKVFSRLILRGQVRSAVRRLTDRAPGQILTPTSVVDPSGKTVFDVLKEKHPEPRCVNANAFIKCEELPPFMDVDVTGGHVERVGRKLQGGAGPGGTTAM